MSQAPAPVPSTTDVPAVPFGRACRVWARIGLLSFGGPAGQIALMHKELVEERKWLSEARFLHALNYCTLLPGPEAQQLATYIGWLLHRTRGGLVAGTLFILPGFVAILLLSLLYARLGQTPAVGALFFGLKAAVLALVFEALLRIGKRALVTRSMALLALASFAAIFLFAVPFPLIVLAAGVFGMVVSRMVPGALATAGHAARTGPSDSLVEAMLARGELEHTRPSRARALRVLLVCTALWFLPLVVLHGALGPEHVFVQEHLFFSKSAVVTFGGAYAVLSYIAQRAVDTYGWLLPGEMLDGLGLAETTPGPLILVVQFVGFLGAYRHAPELPPLLAGVLGSVLTVWVTFVPCFLWIFLGAPYVEAAAGIRTFAAALSAITAAVVGVILNLSLWFALHTLFARVETHELGALRLHVPDLPSLQVPALALCALAFVLLFAKKLGAPKTLLVTALAGLLLRLAPV